MNIEDKLTFLVSTYMFLIMHDQTKASKRILNIQVTYKSNMAANTPPAYIRFIHIISSLKLN